MAKNFDCSDEFLASLAQALVTPAWMADGDCVTEDPRWWDDEASETDKARAIAICAECPVREMCAAWAAKNEVGGVWGGVDQAERDRKRRGRKFVTMEDRRADLDWRTDVASCKPAADLATKWGVSERTIYRWRAEQAA